MMKLSIIVLTYNTSKLTERCVRSILKYYKSLIGKEVEIIVVDNASTDQTISNLKKIQSLKLIENRENYGFSKGNNIGARTALGKYILFLNSDTVVNDY